MLNYLHDIRNKLAILSGQTTLLAKKYGEDDFTPIRTNLMRVNEIVNDAYRFMQQQLEEDNLILSEIEFIKQLDLMTDAVALLYPIEMINEVRNYHPRGKFEVDFDIGLMFQVIENAIDNSIKAKSTRLNIRMLETGDYSIFEMVDNGTQKDNTPKVAVENSVIPHGVGKQIMTQNMEKVGGKVEWTRRIDHSGIIVRLYFPKKT